jgi:hypothetical protein
VRVLDPAPIDLGIAHRFLSLGIGIATALD